ncbi:hypothetical protein D4764_15G0008630 [Takifugu flavidus]|uniref:Uncharacterized protein n=1 Tax=Takifugu flavidus TaxID=433684 RepID=A0A5C6P3H7_9TELE|nr:hypothetical protein D4764_15G0008630 [Takifugu flavidus]
MLVFPLANPVKKVVVSNILPFLKNELLLCELSRHGRMVLDRRETVRIPPRRSDTIARQIFGWSRVSLMRWIPLGCKSPLLRHVVSMVLSNNKEELNLALRFRVDEFDYTVYDKTDSLKCFGCGEGHVIQSSPNNVEDRWPVDPPVSAVWHVHDEGSFNILPQMDAPSHFFFGLQCKNGQRRMLYSLRADNGQVLEYPI